MCLAHSAARARKNSTRDAPKRPASLVGEELGVQAGEYVSGDEHNLGADLFHDDDDVHERQWITPSLGGGVSPTACNRAFPLQINCPAHSRCRSTTDTGSLFCCMTM